MFAFNQIEPDTRGYEDSVPVPLDRFLGAEASEGYHSSIFSSLYNHVELSLADSSGDILPPEEANKRYGIQDLQFNEPTSEGVAKLLHDRKQAELNRQSIIQDGNSSAGRTVMGLGVGMIASVLNPIDMGAMFIPIVGEEVKGAEAATFLGKAGNIIRRGVITRQELANEVGVPKLLESVFSGAAYGAIAELPKQLYAKENHEAPSNPLEGVFQMALMGAAGHALVGAPLEALGNFAKRVSNETHLAMFKKAMDDFAKGNDISVHDIVKLDPAWHEEIANTQASSYWEDLANQRRVEIDYNQKQGLQTPPGEFDAAGKFIAKQEELPIPEDTIGQMREIGEARAEGRWVPVIQDASDNVHVPENELDHHRSILDRLTPEQQKNAQRLFMNTETGEIATLTEVARAEHARRVNEAAQLAHQEVLDNAAKQDPTGNNTPERTKENQQLADKPLSMPEKEIEQVSLNLVKPEASDVSKAKEKTTRVRNERGQFVKQVKEVKETLFQKALTEKEATSANIVKGSKLVDSTGQTYKILDVGKWNDIKEKYPKEAKDALLNNVPKDMPEEKLGKSWVIQYEDGSVGIQGRSYWDDGQEVVRHFADEEKLDTKLEKLQPKTDIIKEGADCILKKLL